MGTFMGRVWFAYDARMTRVGRAGAPMTAWFAYEPDGHAHGAARVVRVRWTCGLRMCASVWGRGGGWVMVWGSYEREYVLNGSV